MHGETSDVVDRYVNHHGDDKIETVEKKDVTPGTNQFSFIYMADRSSNKRAQYKYDEEVIIAIGLQLEKFSDDVELAIRLIDRYKNPIFSITEKLDRYYKATGTSIHLNLVIPPVFIVPGKYSWVISIHQPNVVVHDVYDDVLPFHILDTGSDFAKYGSANYGSVFARYSVENVTSSAL
jgi:hypothetical protein